MDGDRAEAIDEQERHPDPTEPVEARIVGRHVLADVEQVDGEEDRLGPPALGAAAAVEQVDGKRKVRIDVADKTLLICFSTRGGRRLMMPNAVLMQHTDSTRYDLLIVSEPLGKNYMKGVPGLGRNLVEVIEWIARLELTGKYSRIRTLGCSAGGYAAVIASHLLEAEMAVSVGGRFPSKHKHPLTVLNMILITWRVMRKNRCPLVLVSYAADKSRDRKFARVMTRLFGSKQDVVKLTNEKMGHNVIGRLVERGELVPYLARTVFCGTK